MNARLRTRTPFRRSAPLGAAIVAIALTALPGSGQAAPAPCSGVPQITDVRGDGHHASSDVLSAWLSEASGHLQAVIQVNNATWVPEHDDAQINGSGFAFVYALGGQTWFVRATAAPSGAMSYDYGNYTGAGGFVSRGATTGSVEYGVSGAVTIDVPAATGATGAARIASPFVVTYDGINADGPDWVDHAPGGTAPDDASVGADYVMGSCSPAPGPGPGAPGVPGGPAAQAPVSAVRLAAPAKLRGGGVATVTGAVVPARAGVPVTLTRGTRVKLTSTLITAADGSFRTKIPVKETTTLRAVAQTIGSQTLTIDVLSTVRISTRRMRGGRTALSGVVKPALPGRLLLLRSASPLATATKTLPAGRGRFSFVLPRTTRHGRYQVVFIPSSQRAERATSNTGVIK